MITYVSNPTLTQRVRISGGDIVLQLNKRNILLPFEENVEKKRISLTHSHIALRQERGLAFHTKTHSHKSLWVIHCPKGGFYLTYMLKKLNLPSSPESKSSSDSLTPLGSIPHQLSHTEAPHPRTSPLHWFQKRINILFALLYTFFYVMLPDD